MSRKPAADRRRTRSRSPNRASKSGRWRERSREVSPVGADGAVHGSAVFARGSSKLVEGLSRNDDGKSPEDVLLEKAEAIQGLSTDERKQLVQERGSENHYFSQLLPLVESVDEKRRQQWLQSVLSLDARRQAEEIARVTEEVKQLSLTDEERKELDATLSASIRAKAVRLSSKGRELYAYLADKVTKADLVEQYAEWLQDGGPVRVRLLLTTIRPLPRVLERLKVPLMRLFDVSFGSTHAAVQVGPLVFEWLDDELVHVSPLSNWDYWREHVKCALVIHHTGLTEDAMRSAARCIVRWNTTKAYAPLGADPSKPAANCQAFALDLLAALGCTLERTGVVAEYLDAIRRGGKLEACMPTTPGLHLLGSDGKTPLPFTSHAELDAHVAALRRDGNFPAPGTPEYRLLKSWDRAFWIRQCLVPEGACPFARVNPETGKTDEGVILEVQLCEDEDFAGSDRGDAKAA